MASLSGKEFLWGRAPPWPSSQDPSFGLPARFDQRSRIAFGNRLHGSLSVIARIGFSLALVFSRSLAETPSSTPSLGRRRLSCCFRKCARRLRRIMDQDRSCGLFSTYHQGRRFPQRSFCFCALGRRISNNGF